MKMSNNPVIYEVLSKQYLRSILDISADRSTTWAWHFGWSLTGSSTVAILTCLDEEDLFDLIPTEKTAWPSRTASTAW